MRIFTGLLLGLLLGFLAGTFAPHAWWILACCLGLIGVIAGPIGIIVGCFVGLLIGGIISVLSGVILTYVGVKTFVITGGIIGMLIGAWLKKDKYNAHDPSY